MLPKGVFDRLRKKKGPSERINQMFCTMEELEKDVVTVLTASTPHFEENSVEYSYRDRKFEPIENRNRTIHFFYLSGNITRKQPEQQNKDEKKDDERVEELDTKRKNKFNFCDRATQTFNLLLISQHTQTEPLPQMVFEGCVSLAEISSAYREQEIQNAVRSDDVLVKTIKKVSRKNQKLENHYSYRKFFRFCERMIDQNLLSDINIDFSFYDTPSDEFKDKGLGSLLALWKFTYQPMRGLSVTSLSWNTHYPDMFAVAFGTYDMTRRDATGCVCVFSLKCPSHPEKVIPCKSGVFCVAFSSARPHLLAAGFAEGSVVVFDLRRGGDVPVAINKTVELEHNDIVTQVKWLPDNIDGQHNFCSISADSRVINWLLAKSELLPSEVINLRDESVSNGIPEEEKNNLISCGTAISFHPVSSDLFVMATENGSIHKCSNLSTAQYLCAYNDHDNIVYNVQWNPYHPRVFLSCSADWTIRVWDHTRKESVFTFDLLNEVKDVSWAPFSSTLFAAVTNDCKVHIFDILMNRQQPTSTYSLYSSKKNINLTTVQFNPTKPVIIIGDDKGSVISFKLSPNLRSSLKAFETTEKSKFAALEREKMEKILKIANPENFK